MGRLHRSGLYGEEHDDLSACSRRAPEQRHQRQTLATTYGGNPGEPGFRLGVVGWILKLTTSNGCLIVVLSGINSACKLVQFCQEFILDVGNFLLLYVFFSP